VFLPDPEPFKEEKGIGREERDPNMNKENY
jgi:hypothetical protein